MPLPFAHRRHRLFHRRQTAHDVVVDPAPAVGVYSDGVDHALRLEVGPDVEWYVCHALCLRAMGSSVCVAM
jgi:hypothetical protein